MKTAVLSVLIVALFGMAFAVSDPVDEIIPIIPKTLGVHIFTGTPISISCPSYCGAPNKPTCAWNPETYQICSATYDTNTTAAAKRQNGNCDRSQGQCGPLCYQEPATGKWFCDCVYCGSK